jgi:uncharacterized protein (TIGR03086 family)
MTDDLREQHRAALALAATVVANVAAPDLGRSTPCADWDLAELLAHMIGQHTGFARAVRDGVGTHAAHRPVPYTAAGWRDSVADLEAAFARADLDAMAVEEELSPTPLPVRRILQAQLLDTVVHTWDINAALGRPFVPPPPLLGLVVAMAPAIPAAAYGPGAAFAPPLPARGTPWQQTLALVGRSDPWSPDDSGRQRSGQDIAGHGR